MNQIDLDVIECGTQECPPSYSFGPAIRDFYLIHLVHSGKGYFNLDGREFYLKTGDIFAIWPNTVTYYYADSEKPWSYSWVGFHGTKADYYLKHAGFSLSLPVFNCSSHEYVNNCFHQMMSARSLNKSRELHLLGILYLLLSHFAEQAPDQVNTNTSLMNKGEYINKAVEFIKVNYSRTISLSDIASHVGIDGKYLCSLFNENLKTSPHRFLLSLRMDKACELMQNDKLSIGDISRSVGYTDPLLFSKMFKKFKGLSPSKFRDTYINDNI